MNFNLNLLSWNYSESFILKLSESATVMLSVNTGWRYLNIIFGGHTSQQDKLLATISCPTERIHNRHTWDKIDQIWKSILELKMSEVKSVLGHRIVHPGIVQCHQKLLLVQNTLASILLLQWLDDLRRSKYSLYGLTIKTHQWTTIWRFFDMTVTAVVKQWTHNMQCKGALGST